MGPTSSSQKESPSARLRLVVASIFDKNIRGRAWNYVLQCGLPTVSLAIILLVEDVLLQAAVVVAVVSTAFTVHLVPNSIAATPRRVVGGHAVKVGSLVLGYPCFGGPVGRAGNTGHGGHRH